jgi:hypothetical protein
MVKEQGVKSDILMAVTARRRPRVPFRQDHSISQWSRYLWSLRSGPTSRQEREPTGELRDEELNAVTGGLVVNAIIVTLVGLLLRAVNQPEPAKK